MKNTFLTAVGLIVCTLISMPAQAQETITIKGSDTMVTLNRELAAEYFAKTGTRLDVEGRGSESGITALLNGETDIAAASRAMKESELAAFEKQFGTRPQEIIIAQDGIGIYVHNNNPISRLTVEQLAAILKGEIRNWKEVGGLNRRIDIYNRDIYSGTRTFMKSHVLQGAEFSDLAHDVSSTSLLASSVARNQSAIGYGGIGYSQGAHIIRLADQPGHPGYWPSFENVSEGKYPLSRPLFYYINPQSVNADLTAFIDWVLSPAGQNVVTFVGYFPAPGTKSASGFAEASETILLTPENMHQHGFQLSISSQPAGQTKRQLTLAFDPSGQTINRINEISVHLADDLEIPLGLDDSLTAQFTVKEDLLDQASIRLSEDPNEETSPVYTIALGAFTSR